MEAASFYRQLALTLRPGDEIPQDDLLAHLESIGYERREPVELVGEYSVRGGILDVFSPGAKPVRIEMFGDEIESIRRFEVESQRSVLKVSECTLLPLREYQRSRPLLSELADRLREAGMASRDLPSDGSPFAGWEMLVPLIRERAGDLFSLADRPIVIWDEPELTRAAADRLWKRLRAPDRPQWCPPERAFRTYEEIREASRKFVEIEFRGLDVTAATDALHLSTRPSTAFHGNMRAAIAEARNLVEGGQRVAFFGSTAGEVERVADIFHEYNVAYQLGLEQTSTAPEYLAQRAYMAGDVANIFLIQGRVARGVVLQESKLAIFGSEDLFDSSALVAKPSASQLLSTFSSDNFDLKPGDFVVHAEHGVAQFLGLREIQQGETKGDYMLLEYAGGSKLYVPLHAHGSDRAIPRRGQRCQAAARPHGRRYLDPYQVPRQGQNAGHGRGASQALRPAQNGGRVSLTPPTPTGSASSKTPSNRPKRAIRNRRSTTSNATWNPPSQWIACFAAMSVSARQKS